MAEEEIFFPIPKKKRKVFHNSGRGAGRKEIPRKEETEGAPQQRYSKEGTKVKRAS